MIMTIINRKKYTVERVFNMVANYEFTDKNGVIHLVDAEDVQGWEYGDGKSTVYNAIAYAKYYAKESEDGVFWWKVK